MIDMNAGNSWYTDRGNIIEFAFFWFETQNMILFTLHKVIADMLKSVYDTHHHMYKVWWKCN